jgi:hypothetical protein
VEARLLLYLTPCYADNSLNGVFKKVNLVYYLGMKYRAVLSSSIVGLLVSSLAIATTQPSVAQDPPSIPRPPDVIMLGYTTDGNPIYGPAPSTEGLPVSIAPDPINPIDVGTSNDPRPYYTYKFSDGTTMDFPAGRDANGNFMAVPPPIGAILVGESTAERTLPPLRVNMDGSRIEADGRYTPPPLFNPDGSVYGGEPVLRIPGATDAAPFGFKQDGTPVPPPLFNPDGTPFVLGVSPIPVPKKIIGAPFGYDALGTPVPAPLWNPDGTPYVHGVSELPDVPASLRRPIALTDPIAREIVNQEIAAAEILAKKTRKGYLLDTEDQISYVDKTLKVVASKRGAKPRTLTLSVDENGDLFVPTTSSLKGFQLQIKRGAKVIKAILLK